MAFDVDIFCQPEEKTKPGSLSSSVIVEVTGLDVLVNCGTVVGILSVGEAGINVVVGTITVEVGRTTVVVGTIAVVVAASKVAVGAIAVDVGLGGTVCVDGTVGEGIGAAPMSSDNTFREVLPHFCIGLM